ncbi:MAG: type II secretion system F family protein [Mycobacteriales bacterium]
MGVFVGLLFGIGAFMVGMARLTDPPKARARTGKSTWRERTDDMLLQAGVEGVSARQFVSLSASLFLVVFALMLALSRVETIALAFACFAAAGPLWLVRARRRKRTVELREVWPEAVDNLASAIRAGLSLPEALSALGTRGPEMLRGPFERFAGDFRATGAFNDSLDRLKHSLADPVGDRVIEALRMAREVGGTDLGRLLRTLSTFLREDARVRAELETRQSWTVNAARLALAAPWMILLLLSIRSEAVRAYRTPAGAIVLMVGAATSAVAYRVMLRIAQLPEEARVLR